MENRVPRLVRMDFYVKSVLACQHLSQGCCTLFLYTVTGDISKVVHVFLCKPQWVKRLQKTHLTSKRQKLSCTKLRPRCANFLLDKKLPPFFSPRVCHPPTPGGLLLLCNFFFVLYTIAVSEAHSGNCTLPHIHGNWAVIG